MPDLNDTSSPLTERLRQLINSNGPITFRDWMEIALYDPEHGYYCRQEKSPWGREGDYRTSPERTSLFAASFARYFVELYQQLGQPKQWMIVEAGAGAGHFAEGVLSTLQRQFPELFAATKYVISERSASSSSLASARLSRFHDRVSFASLEEIDDDEIGIVFSNELLDAFPIHRVTFEDGKLRELYVALDGQGWFRWISGPLSSSALAEYFDLVEVAFAEEGHVAEINLAVRDWLSGVAARFDRGYVVTVDYGDEARNLFESPDRRQGTLRAFRRHQVENVLSNPGEHDITTTVDWTYVKKVGEQVGLRTERFDRLDQFLLQAGLLEQLELMTDLTSSEAERASLRAGAREMILPTGMAASFQVLVQTNS
ncbi:MAG TPA: SAM-dependent methyltransferase [Pyrinomonadaceae bacterium]|nr:SAM-dependent methyltransferase [Pyrinomonadaceae bacterium]